MKGLKLSRRVKVALVLATMCGVIGYSVCIYAMDKPSPKGQKKSSILKEIKKSKTTSMTESDFVGDDIFAVQVVEDEYIGEQKRIEEEKRKAEEEAKKAEQAAQANRSASLVNYTGRYRLSICNDSDETMIQRINSCFEGYPVAGLGEHIVNVGQQYNIDPYFIAAVIWEESGRGVSPLAQNNNNLFGRKSLNGWRVDDSFASSISSFGQYIVDVYFNYGLYSIETIAQKYCPNQGWDVKIIRHMKILMG